MSAEKAGSQPISMKSALKDSLGGSSPTENEGAKLTVVAIDGVSVEPEHQEDLEPTPIKKGVSDAEWRELQPLWD